MLHMTALAKRLRIEPGTPSLSSTGCRILLKRGDTDDFQIGLYQFSIAGVSSIRSQAYTKYYRKTLALVIEEPAWKTVGRVRFLAEYSPAKLKEQPPRCSWASFLSEDYTARFDKANSQQS